MQQLECGGILWHLGNLEFFFTHDCSEYSYWSTPNYYKIDNESKAHFTLGVEAKVEVESSIPTGAIIEISSKGFILRVKAEFFLKKI